MSYWFTCCLGETFEPEEITSCYRCGALTHFDCPLGQTEEKADGPIARCPACTPKEARQRVGADQD